MKKFFLAVTLLGTLHCSLAQTAKTSKLRWGVKTGFNGSNTTNGFGIPNPPENFKDPAIRGTVYGGVFAQLALAERLTLQPELIYSPEGSLQDGKIGNPADNRFVLIFTNKLNYLNIPLMLQYEISRGLYLEAGPQIGFLLSSKQINSNPSTGTPSNSDQKAFTKGTNFSLGAGLGYNFKNGFGVSARYVTGLSDVHTVAPEMKISTIQIGTHYRFGK